MGRITGSGVLQVLPSLKTDKMDGHIGREVANVLPTVYVCDLFVTLTYLPPTTDNLQIRPHLPFTVQTEYTHFRHKTRHSSLLPPTSPLPTWYPSLTSTSLLLCFLLVPTGTVNPSHLSPLSRGSTDPTPSKPLLTPRRRNSTLETLRPTSSGVYSPGLGTLDTYDNRYLLRPVT